MLAFGVRYEGQGPKALIADGRVKVNGTVLSSPACNVTASDRIELDALIVRTAREQRERHEVLSGHPMQPSKEESAALDRIAYWERYLIRWRSARRAVEGSGSRAFWKEGGVRRVLSRLGARLGNWNDQRTQFDCRSEHTRGYRLIDRLAHSWCFEAGGMSTITVTLDEQGARALIAGSSFLDLIFRAQGHSSPFPPGESPRDIAVLQLVSALERQEQPTTGFEALGVTDEPNPHVQRTWQP